MKITHYDLFAGIGGFSLALDQVFYESEINHIFCEWEAFPTAVLKKHWPEGEYYGDIADLVADTERKGREGKSRKTERQHRLCDRSRENKDLTILTGGFPCQPFSHAGRRQGTSDDRYKWPEMFAVIKNVRPDWVIAENVRGLASWNDGMVLETVCTDLESQGYEVRPYIVPACGKGAPHRRERVWIVANATKHDSRGDIRELHKKNESQPESQEQHEDKGGELGDAGQQYASNTRRERWSERTSESLQSKSQESEWENSSDSGWSWNRDWRKVAFDTSAEVILETEELIEEDASGEPIRKTILSLPTPARNDGVDDGLPRKMDGAILRGKRTDNISASKHRQERLKACGNAIVPQVAVEIFRAIKTTMI